MTKTKYWLSIVAIAAVLIAGSLAVSPIAIADDDDDDDDDEFEKGKWLVAETVPLEGLQNGKLRAILDTTPNEIVRAHIVLTGDAAACTGGADQPSNVLVIVGQAGVALSTPTLANTGIAGSGSQCVFHLTIEPGKNGVSDPLTDIVVKNVGSGFQARTAISVTAEVSPADD